MEQGQTGGQSYRCDPEHVWSIRTKLQIEGRTRDLAMFNLAVESKLRGCDVIAIEWRMSLPADTQRIERRWGERKPDGLSLQSHTKIESTVRYLGIEDDVFAKVRSACVAVITALLGPSQIQMVAQHVEARGPRRDFELSFDPLTIIAADILSGVASCFCAPSWSLRQCTVKSSIHLNASQGRIFWPHLRA